MFDITEIDKNSDQAMVIPTSKGRAVTRSTTPATIQSQLPDNGRDWFILQPRDYPTELRADDYLKIFDKKNRPLTRGSRGDGRYIYVFEKLRPIIEDVLNGGGNGSSDTSNKTNRTRVIWQS